ncbi:hypothetical protein ACFL6I_28955, partial [candidate division KSB1 bacterium]
MDDHLAVGDDGYFISCPNDGAICDVISDHADYMNDLTNSCTGDPDCDDGLYCNGIEICVSGDCISGTPVDCSVNDLLEIVTCSNNPDNNPFTWDYFPGFTSTCDEASDSCTSGSVSLSHACDISNCGAECEVDGDCALTECNSMDGCVGNDYHDYGDMVNLCLGDCDCESNACADPVITTNDPRCVECVIDEDCDDGIYCNGMETCPAGDCIAGTPIDCSANNLLGIATCNNNPDNNPFTWDYFAGFTSTCDEINDVCTAGSTTVTSTCGISSCGAECESDADCALTECNSMDGCIGNDYYDYEDMINLCLEDCDCENNACADPVITTDDPLCVECVVDGDCDDGNSSTIDTCVDYQCQYEPIIIDCVEPRDFMHIFTNTTLCPGSYQINSTIFVENNVELKCYDTEIIGNR